MQRSGRFFTLYGQNARKPAWILHFLCFCRRVVSPQKCIPERLRLTFVLRYTWCGQGISLKGWGISLKGSGHNVKRLAISLKGTVTTGFAAIFISLKGSEHIVKRFWLPSSTLWGYTYGTWYIFLPRIRWRVCIKALFSAKFPEKDREAINRISGPFYSSGPERRLFGS